METDPSAHTVPPYHQTPINTNATLHSSLIPINTPLDVITRPHVGQFSVLN